MSTPESRMWSAASKIDRNRACPPGVIGVRAMSLGVVPSYWRPGSVTTSWGREEAAVDADDPALRVEREVVGRADLGVLDHPGGLPELGQESIVERGAHVLGVLLGAEQEVEGQAVRPFGDRAGPPAGSRRRWRREPRCRCRPPPPGGRSDLVPPRRRQLVISTEVPPTGGNSGVSCPTTPLAVADEHSIHSSPTMIPPPSRASATSGHSIGAWRRTVTVADADCSYWSTTW
jgi:hypothetical protein